MSAPALLIDIGNSRVKWAQATPGGGALQAHGAYAYEHPQDEDLRGSLSAALMQVLPRAVSAAVIVSVGRQALAQGVAQSLRRERSARVVLAQVQREFRGLTVGYNHPSHLGVDRWVAMLGAGRLVGYPCTVVDLGTAVTVDAVDRAGQHLGGAIAPGRTLQRRSLRQSTARIRTGEREPAPSSLFARDTAEAVAAGVDHGLAALVNLAQADAARELALCGSLKADRAWPPLLVTGGDAPDLLPLLPAHAQHVDDLVLEGARSLLEGAEEIR
ncbi:MAG: type III pantothenate kinase [Pseudomonadota bacterium]